MPDQSVSNRDTIFLSNFRQEMMKLAGVQLAMSSSYHPQTDGQTERVNRCLETYLRCSCSLKHHSWHKWLPLAEFWYNSSYYSSIKMSPYKALYGEEAKHLSVPQVTANSKNSFSDLFHQSDKLQSLLQHYLLTAQHRMKLSVDKGRVERQLQVGDSVFLKLHPYRQHLVQFRRNLKLSPRFYGTYKIVEKIGSVAYKHELPPDSRIHPVFHISLLKEKLKDRESCCAALPELKQNGKFNIYPIAILDSRTVQRPKGPIPQLLVHWACSSSTQAFWEDAAFISQQFGHSNPCGQGFQILEGIVTNFPENTIAAQSSWKTESKKDHAPNETSAMVAPFQPTESPRCPMF